MITLSEIRDALCEAASLATAAELILSAVVVIEALVVAIIMGA